VPDSVGYYIETTVEPWGVAAKTIHVTGQPPQVSPRLNESSVNLITSKVLTGLFGRVIDTIGVVVIYYKIAKTAETGVGVIIHSIPT
jgi:hypothetical protein